MMVCIQHGQCVIECQNHYSGYGVVTTRGGLEIYTLGAPRLYRNNSPSGKAEDMAVVHEQNKKSAAIFDKLLKDSDFTKWGTYLTGNFLIVIHNRKNATCWIITDFGNSFHLYESRTNKGIIFSTNLDRLAHIAVNLEAVDYVSLAEQLMYSSITYPNTAYREIKETEYAACIKCRYDRGAVRNSIYKYWLPTCRSGESSSDINELAEQLRSGICYEMEDILADKKNVALFLSGGVDSRALAGLMSYFGISGTGITIADAQNTETNVANKVTIANKLQHEMWFRDLEYYPRLLDEVINVDSACARFHGALFIGFRDEINRRGYDAVLGGYMSDTLLKLHEANVVKKIFFGRDCGTLEVFDSTNPTYLRGGDVYIQRFSHLFKSDVLFEARERRRKIMEYWNNLRTDGSAWEWSWIWPFSRNKHNGNLTMNIFSFPAFEVFTSRSILDVARVAQQRIKINGRLFNKALYPFLKTSAHIPVAVTRLPIYKNRWLHESMIILKHFPPRRFMFKEPKYLNPVANDTSWPDTKKMWDVSALIRSFRLEYNSFDFENEMMIPRNKSIFDRDRYGDLPENVVYHIMYTMLYFDRWNKRRTSSKI